MQGWVSLHRKSLESVVFQNPNLWQVWCYCLLRANHKKNRILFEGKELNIKPGQFITGRFQGSKDCKMKPSTFRNQLEKLKILKNLDIESDNKNSIITIVNWAQYQDTKQKEDSEKDNKRTTDGQQKDTDDNDDNDSNDNNLREKHEHALSLSKKTNSNSKHKTQNWRHRKRNENEEVFVTREGIQKYFSRAINQRDLNEINNIAEKYGIGTMFELFTRLSDKIYSTNIWDEEIIETTSKELIYREKVYEDEKNRITKKDIKNGKLDPNLVAEAKELIAQKEKVIIKKIEPENKPVHLNLIPDFDAKTYADKHAVN